MTGITPEQRAEWRRLTDEASPGPWHSATNRHPTTTGLPWVAMELVPHPAGGAGKALFRWEGWQGQKDSRFIATARTAIPALLNALDAAEEELAVLRAQREELLALLREVAVKLRHALDGGS